MDLGNEGLVSGHCEGCSRHRPRGYVNPSACVGIVSEILGGKSINTVEKRLRQMSSFVAWCAKSGHEPFPVTVHLFRAFFKHMVKEKAKPSAFKGAIEVMNFSKHVLGLCIEGGVGNSPWVRGILRKAKQDKPMTSRARALLCLEVLALERTLIDEEVHAYDRFAALRCWRGLDWVTCSLSQTLSWTSSTLKVKGQRATSK